MDIFTTGYLTGLTVKHPEACACIITGAFAGTAASKRF